MTIRGRSGRITRTDGPFAETKEFLGGFFLIEAPDLDEAIGIVESDPMDEMGSIEIRPFLEQTHSVTGQGRPPLRKQQARASGDGWRCDRSSLRFPPFRVVRPERGEARVQSRDHRRRAGFAELQQPPAI